MLRRYFGYITLNKMLFKLFTPVSYTFLDVSTRKYIIIYAAYIMYLYIFNYRCIEIPFTYHTIPLLECTAQVFSVLT